MLGGLKPRGPEGIFTSKCVIVDHAKTVEPCGTMFVWSGGRATSVFTAPRFLQGAVMVSMWRCSQDGLPLADTHLGSCNLWLCAAN